MYAIDNLSYIYEIIGQKIIFLPPPPKKAHNFIASKQCHFLGFHLRKQRKGGEETTGVRGVEERMKGEIVNYILLKC